MGEMADCGDECTETLRDIETFLDGEADDLAKVRIEVHLADCSPCMHKADFRKHLKELVRDRCHEERVPDPLAEKIRAILRDPA
jgi:mycothiol system anti-sigma-R factor